MVDPHALQQFCHSCVRDEINGQIKELKESELPDEEKGAKQNKLHARLTSWSPKGRRVSGVAVLGKGGGVSDDPFGDIKGHWEKVFNNCGGSDAAADAFGRFVQKCPGDLEPISRDEFYNICDVNRRFAPGPDGVSYRTWKACGREAHDILYDCYLKILTSGTAPAWFNSARMVFIPEIDDEEYCESVVAEPGDLRPLSLSNCDHKLVCVAVCCSLRRICDSTVHEAQRGFRKGKQLTDNVLSLNAFTKRHLILGALLPAQILKDIKAAFPSVLWSWVVFVLERLACPWWLVNADKALYRGSSVTLSLGSTVGPGFQVSSGI